MSMLSRLFGIARDPRDELRPLWHRAVAIAREERWYAEMGVDDSVAGRFDMITAVLSLLLLRMENDDHLKRPSVFLTELFVEDMDGQLRESGLGDQVVGKHIGRLMSVLGGRLGALREALAQENDDSLREYVHRNVSLVPEAEAASLAAGLRSLSAQFDETSSMDILEAKLPS